jgi:hypothetical protein
MTDDDFEPRAEEPPPVGRKRNHVPEADAMLARMERVRRQFPARTWVLVGIYPEKKKLQAVYDSVRNQLHRLPVRWALATRSPEGQHQLYAVWWPKGEPFEQASPSTEVGG